jgi:hypothetical protein
VGNGDNRTYIGQDGRTFSFSLPEEARDVRFQNDSTGTRFIQTDTGYADTEPIRPDAEGLSIVASYDIPYDDDTLAIEAPLPADVASLNVLMREMGANISGEQIQFVETRQVEGDSFSIHSGANFEQGEILSLKLTNLDELRFTNVSSAPGVTVPGRPVNQALLRWLVIGLGGLAIIGVGLVYPRLRPQLTHQAGVHHENPNIRRQKLLLTLARLDEVFEAGELDQEVYLRARAKYKVELVEIMEG